MANEVLYALYAVDDFSKEKVSKLALQKLLYLSGTLAPIKDIVLSYLRFRYEKRGPYSKDIQNTVDHLVATGFAEVVDFEKIYDGKYALADYKISEAGEKAVKMLRQYYVEDEIFWWINIVTRLAIAYTKAIGFEDEDLDNIMKLVYQDPSFKNVKEKENYYHLIDLGKKEALLTNQLIEFLKEYSKDKTLRVAEENDRKKAEMILLTFFEYLYVNYLSEERV